MFCPACGAQSGDGDAFCPICGADLRNTASPQPAAPAPPAPPMPPVPPAPPVPPQPTTPMPAAPVQPQPTYVPPTAAVAVGSSALYAKAPVGSRLLAVIVDGIIAGPLLPLGLLLVYAGAATGKPSIIGFVLVGLGGIWQLAYTLGRDGMGGAGFGKRMTGLVVTQSATGAPAGMGASIVRQLIFYVTNLIPGIGSLIEPVLVLVNKDGRRLGDKAAKTQVARSADVSARGFSAPGGKGLAVTMLIVTLLGGIVGAGVGGFAFAKALQEATGGSFDIDTTLGLNGATDGGSGSTTVTGEPEDAITAFYEAVAGGDIDTIRATMTADLASQIDDGYFEGWTSPSYSVITTDSNGSDQATIELQEYDGGLSNGMVTFSLVAEDGSWKIAGWELGTTPLDDTQSDSPGNVLTPETAIDAVGTMLVALQQDDIAGMRAVATQSMQDSSPEYFSTTSGAFIDFEIVDAYQDAATYVVVVKEDWNSGPENLTYIVVDDNGTARVDGVLWE